MGDHEILGSTCVIKVNLQCCKGCHGEIKKKLQKVDGVTCVLIDAKEGLVTVRGRADPATVLKVIKKTGKRAQLHSFSNQPNLKEAHETKESKNNKDTHGNQHRNAPSIHHNHDHGHQGIHNPFHMGLPAGHGSLYAPSAPPQPPPLLPPAMPYNYAYPAAPYGGARPPPVYMHYTVPPQPPYVVDPLLVMRDRNGPVGNTPFHYLRENTSNCKMI